MVFTVSNADSHWEWAQSQQLRTELTCSSHPVQASVGVYGRLWSIGPSGTQAPSNCGFTGFWDSPPPFFHIFNWRILALQCCVGFCHPTTESGHHSTYISSLPSPAHPSRLSQSTRLGPRWHVAAPCRLAALHTWECVHVSAADSVHCILSFSHCGTTLLLTAST